MTPHTQPNIPSRVVQTSISKVPIAYLSLVYDVDFLTPEYGVFSGPFRFDININIDSSTALLFL